MSTLHIALVQVQDTAQSGAPVSVTPSEPRATEILTVGATTVRSTLVAQEGEVWVLTPRGGDIALEFGTSSVVATLASADHILLAGIPREFGADRNQYLAAINA